MLKKLEIWGVAKEQKYSDIVFFGHTHVPFLRKGDGVTFANPGSTDKPRQTSRESTYMIMSVDETSGPDFEIKKCFI